MERLQSFFLNSFHFFVCNLLILLGFMGSEYVYEKVRIIYDKGNPYVVDSLVLQIKTRVQIQINGFRSVSFPAI